jgi:hypothetical protein
MLLVTLVGHRGGESEVGYKGRREIASATVRAGVGARRRETHVCSTSV